MKKIILIIVSFAFALTVFSQNEDTLIQGRPLNNISLNLGGDVSLLSINYEKQYVLNANLILSSKIGMGYYTVFCFLGCGQSPSSFTIPHHVTLNWGKGRFFIEFGLGGTFLFGNTLETYVFYPIIGYRILPLKSKKISFRIYWMKPFPKLKSEVMNYGINAGYSF